MELFSGEYICDVSIHATLAGGDIRSGDYKIPRDVSIHATLAGGDLWQYYEADRTEKFLSTPPSRVATFQTEL